MPSHRVHKKLDKLLFGWSCGRVHDFISARCDIQEVFRALIEDFLIEYHQNIEPESFEEKAKRAFLKQEEKLKMILELNQLFKKKVPYNRRNYSKTSTIQTIIKEETIKLAQYVRGSKSMYAPIFEVI